MRVSILLLFVAIAICATLANPVDSKNSKDPKGLSKIPAKKVNPANAQKKEIAKASPSKGSSKIPAKKVTPVKTAQEKVIVKASAPKGSSKLPAKKVTPVKAQKQEIVKAPAKGSSKLPAKKVTPVKTAQEKVIVKASAPKGSSKLPAKKVTPVKTAQKKAPVQPTKPVNNKKTVALKAGNSIVDVISKYIKKPTNGKSPSVKTSDSQSKPANAPSVPTGSKVNPAFLQLVFQKSLDKDFVAKLTAEARQQAQAKLPAVPVSSPPNVPNSRATVYEVKGYKMLSKQELRDFENFIKNPCKQGKRSSDLGSALCSNPADVIQAVKKQASLPIKTGKDAPALKPVQATLKSVYLPPSVQSIVNKNPSLAVDIKNKAPVTQTQKVSVPSAPPKPGPVNKINQSPSKTVVPKPSNNKPNSNSKNKPETKVVKPVQAPAKPAAKPVKTPVIPVTPQKTQKPSKVQSQSVNKVPTNAKSVVPKGSPKTATPQKPIKVSTILQSSNEKKSKTKSQSKIQPQSVKKAGKPVEVPGKTKVNPVKVPAVPVTTPKKPQQQKKVQKPNSEKKSKSESKNKPETPKAAKPAKIPAKSKANPVKVPAGPAITPQKPSKVSTILQSSKSQSKIQSQSVKKVPANAKSAVPKVNAPITPKVVLPVAEKGKVIDKVPVRPKVSANAQKKTPNSGPSKQQKPKQSVKVPANTKSVVPKVNAPITPKVVLPVAEKAKVTDKVPVQQSAIKVSANAQKKTPSSGPPKPKAKSIKKQSPSQKKSEKKVVIPTKKL